MIISRVRITIVLNKLTVAIVNDEDRIIGKEDQIVSFIFVRRRKSLLIEPSYECILIYARYIALDGQ